MRRWLHRLASGNAVKKHDGRPDPEKLEPVVREIEQKVKEQRKRLDFIEQELAIRERRSTEQQRRDYGNLA